MLSFSRWTVRLTDAFRPIQSVHSRYIVFEDGAHLTFPRRDEFDCREDFILWGRLAYRIGIAEEF